MKQESNIIKIILIAWGLKIKEGERCAKDNELKQCGIKGVACCQWTEPGHMKQLKETAKRNGNLVADKGLWLWCITHTARERM